jgi:hypothetical protein
MNNKLVFTYHIVELGRLLFRFQKKAIINLFFTKFEGIGRFKCRNDTEFPNLIVNTKNLFLHAVQYKF